MLESNWTDGSDPDSGPATRLQPDEEEIKEEIKEETPPCF